MRTIRTIVLLIFLSACAQMEPEPFDPSAAHISTDTTVTQSDIPELVQHATILPEPEPPKEMEKYTVVVNEVPIKELLFALARDAQINVDISPGIEGLVTINAVDQTLPQLLDRITRQVSLRYEINNNNLLILPDEPFIRTYTVGYLNLSRDTTGSVTVSTQIASASAGGDSGGGGGGGGGGGAGGGGNTSTTSITSESNHQFWETLDLSIRAILSTGVQGEEVSEEAVVMNPESGIVSVRATASQHEDVQRLIDQVLESVQRQVLIQATVVEVDLSDQYQAGIDWSVIDLTDSGFTFASTLLGGAPGSLAGPPNTSSSFVLNYSNLDSQGERLSAAVSLLAEFGNTRVLSSPQIMVLNNHTAVLKVVENFVYFEVEQEIESGNALIGQGPLLATTTTARTIPVGLVLSVTPQISKDDSVTLNVRPTISSVIRTEVDPNPGLTLVQNRIPVVRVREMESILRINSRQIAVLGGLMQDTYRNQDKKTPLVAEIPVLGDLFKSKNREALKSELVIFLRPVVVKNASLEGDLSNYRQFLKTNNAEMDMTTGQGQ